MSVRAVLRSEFDRLMPHNPALEHLLVEEVEWFSNRSGSLLGVIARGDNVAGWNYVILKRDREGDFHVRKVMSNFFSPKDARVDLLLSMAEIGNIQSACRGMATPWLPSIQVESAAMNPGR